MLCREIRQYLIDTVKETGGHLASNLGAVEMTVALHYVFDEKDKIVWDVGHQSYVHKILTGRKDKLASLRQKDGLSGFPKPSESEYDSFLTGHASTSISAGLGLCAARDLQGESYNVISVIGDGAFTGGLVYEAFNNIADKKILVVLNDNDMSISRNVGKVSLTLSKLRLGKNYNRFKSGMTKFFGSIPLVGKFLINFFTGVKNFFKGLFGANTYFSNFGIKYIGPFDGNDIKKTVKILTAVKKDLNRPVLLHLVTKKGKGMTEAEENPEKFHGISPKNHAAKEYSYSETAGKTICELAEKNDKIAAVCAAMPSGTGLEEFKNKFADRFFDVGIAEEHAVTFAAAMAKGGMKPFVCVYSTFLQRGFDQILHDVCADDLPVTFCLDRAGFVGSDGETHQGLYDLSYLSLMPNMSVLCPKDTEELKNMIVWAAQQNHPLAIRYPKETDVLFDSHSEIELGRWEKLADNKSDVTLFAVGGNMISLAQKVAQKTNANVVNARFVKPIDEKMLLERSSDRLWVVLEENQQNGGLASQISLFASENKLKPEIRSVSVKDKFVPQATIEEQMEDSGFDENNILKIIND